MPDRQASLIIDNANGVITRLVTATTAYPAQPGAVPYGGQHLLISRH